MTTTRRFWQGFTGACALVVGLAGLTAASGCSHVLINTAPYYEDGPWQLDPPQGELQAGTHVLVVGRKGTYSHVWTITGVDAYVWDGDLHSIFEGKREPPPPKELKQQPTDAESGS